MVLSYLAGLSVSGRASAGSIAGFIALCLYVNSKQALTVWIRSDASSSQGPRAAFIAQALAASVILFSLLGTDLVRFLPYAVVPMTYLVLLRFSGEHAFPTEVAGFTLLSLSSLISRYVLSGEIDLRLYLAVAIFFAAGVFKVRAKLRRGTFERASMVFYVIAALVAYHLIEIPLVVLLPLADNLIFAVFLYRVKLKTAGWIEVIKGVAYLVLITSNYKMIHMFPAYFR